MLACQECCAGTVQDAGANGLGGEWSLNQMPNKNSTNLNIAGAESIPTARAFKPYLDQSVFDIVQLELNHKKNRHSTPKFSYSVMAHHNQLTN